MATIGWTQERMDEILVPVIRDMNQRENEGTQANITRFFGGGVGVGARQVTNADKEGAAPRNRTGKESGRMRNAFQRLRGEAARKRRVEGLGEEIVDDDAPALEDTSLEVNEPVAKPGARKREQSANEPGLGEDFDVADGDDDEAFEPKPKKKSRKKRRA